MRLKKGDDIVVLAGKYRGLRAKVERAIPDRGEVVLDTLNISKRHLRQQQANPRGGAGNTGVMQGGIIDKFMPLDASNVALWCPTHKGPARVGIEADGDKKKRVCRQCGGAL